MRKTFYLLVPVLLLSLIPLDAQAGNSSTSWQIPSKEFNQDTAGFAAPFSAYPGTTISISLTCAAPTYYLTIYRMGFYGGKGAKLVMQTPRQACIKQKEARTDLSKNLVVEKWKVVSRIDSSHLAPGMYLARINASDGHQSFVPFVLKDRVIKNRVVISVPFLTSLAYNTFTGQSAYGKNGDFSNRARVLSFSTPFSEGYGSGIYYFYLQPLLVLIDKLKLDPTFVTDVDIALDPHLLQGAKVLISGGHDEYWTKEERDNVIRAREKGTNLIFFGANAEYWRVRLNHDTPMKDLQMVIYKSKTEDPDKSSPSVKFLDQGLPESKLTYQNYNCFKTKGEFQVSNPGAFIFNGTGAKSGSVYPGIMGPEIDHELTSDTYPGTRYVLNRSYVKCGKYFWDQKSSSTIVLGVIPNEGGTISLGDMNWVERGLTTMAPKTTFAFVTKVSTNILEAAVRGPLGKQQLKVN